MKDDINEMKDGDIMRLASIDVGTNSCRMLVLDFENDETKVVKKDLEITRLGEGVDNKRRLSNPAIKRTYLAIKKFLKEIESLNVSKIRIVGTSALRDVSNSEKLIDRVLKEFNVNFDIISGEEEARLNFIANDYDSCNNLIIDIGGGSTEFIWKEGDKILFKSLDMGSVRMTERFIKDPSNKISQIEINKIKSNVKELILENLNPGIGYDKVLGLGGTITTLAAIDLSLEEYQPEKIESYLLKKKTIVEIIKSLSNMINIERQKVKGLQPGRADVIIAGSVVLESIMELFNIDEIMASEYDLLYGVIFKMREKG
ncbi:MAG: Ppx/GppA family phosphatase [Halanaerobiaceae bacterium]